MTLQSHSQEELGGGEIWTNTLMHAVTKKKKSIKNGIRLCVAVERG